LVIESNNSLTSLDGLQNLTTIGRDLVIRSNRVLPTSEAQALVDRLVANGFTGKITIERNK